MQDLVMCVKATAFTHEPKDRALKLLTRLQAALWESKPNAWIGMFRLGSGKAILGGEFDGKHIFVSILDPDGYRPGPWMDWLVYEIEQLEAVREKQKLQKRLNEEAQDNKAREELEMARARLVAAGIL